MSQGLGWGHININVRDLDRSVAFYQALGFELFMPSIPYLGLKAACESILPAAMAEALAIHQDTLGRACIMQLDKGLPKLDLTEFSNASSRAPLQNQDLGIVRICLVSQDLHADYRELVAGLGLSIGDIAAWIDSSTHYSFATKGAVL